MKHPSILFTASTLLAVSCGIEPLQDTFETARTEQTIVIEAVHDDNDSDTKTVRNEDGSVSWQAGDQISLFFGSGSNGGSAFTTTDSGKTASFTGTIGAFTAGGEDFDGGMTYFWGLYPYDPAATCNNTSVTTSLSSAQVGTAGSFSPGQHVTIARSENLLMSFKSVVSGLKFSLQTEGIESAVFHPLGDEAIVGDITISMSDNIPVVTSMSNTSSEITLVPEGGVFEVGKDYYFEFAPFTAASGFEVIFYKGNQQASFTYNSSRTFARNKFTSIANIDAMLGEWTSSMEYVDLGLSVMWATCNLGASKPEEYGGYYQWAGTKDVTSTNLNLGWDNAPYHTGSSSVSGWAKYIPSSKTSYWSGAGSPDNKTNLDPEDDTAHAALRDKWRMPTDDEWTELRENCTWTWTTENGTNGHRVTSKKPGYTDKSIFLPAAGYRSGNDLNGFGTNGRYWASSLKSDYPENANYVNFGSLSIYRDFNYRFLGQSIRPVYGLAKSKPSVRIEALADPHAPMVIAHMTITDDGGSAVTSYGIEETDEKGNSVYRTSYGPDGRNDWYYNVSVYGAPSITLYFRAFATNQIGTAYSPIVKVTYTSGN